MACPPNIWNGIYYLYQACVEKLMRPNRQPNTFLNEIPLLQFLGSTELSELQTRVFAEQNLIFTENEAKSIARSAVSRLFGDRIKFLATGGAPTSTKILSFIREMFPHTSFADSYGATECGAITSNGRPVLEKKVRIRVLRVCCKGVVKPYTLSESDWGELIVSSPNLSSGYYLDPDLTSESFIQLNDAELDENSSMLTWYRTGDLVRVRDVKNHKWINGYSYWNPHVKVMGRLNAAVELAPNGENEGVLVSPDLLESIYSVSPLLSRIFIHGMPNGQSKALVAIIARTDALYDAVRQKFSLKDDEFITDKNEKWLEEERNVLLDEMEQLRKENQLEIFDMPRAIFVESAMWTEKDGFMNSSFKKQRHKFLSHYDEILRLLHEPFLISSESKSS
jgi:fatty acid CoA ligase FadD9